MPIPLYRYDGALIDFISPNRAEKLFDAGRAKLVRHKKGAINRFILHRMPGEPVPMRVADYLGKRYSYQQHLEGGHRCWTLKSLSAVHPRTTVHVERLWKDCADLSPGLEGI